MTSIHDVDPAIAAMQAELEQLRKEVDGWRKRYEKGEIRDIAVDAEFAPHMIYVRNDDKPGFIGRFGTLLGESGVNVATFALGRDKPGGDAICFVSVDQPVSDELLRKIEEIPQVKRARAVRF